MFIIICCNIAECSFTFLHNFRKFYYNSIYSVYFCIWSTRFLYIYYINQFWNTLASAQGFLDLFWMPVDQYKKDGHVVKGIQRGAQSFGLSTASAALEISQKLVGVVQVGYFSNLYILNLKCFLNNWNYEFGFLVMWIWFGILHIWAFYIMLFQQPLLRKCIS